LCVVHAGFYLRQGSAVNKWKFHIQGGGWCTSLESCYQRSQTLLGSSQFFTPYVMSCAWVHEVGSNLRLCKLAHIRFG
jgi:hypothetical protein